MFPAMFSNLENPLCLPEASVWTSYPGFSQILKVTLQKNSAGYEKEETSKDYWSELEESDCIDGKDGQDNNINEPMSLQNVTFSVCNYCFD